MMKCFDLRSASIKTLRLVKGLCLALFFISQLSIAGSPQSDVPVPRSLEHDWMSISAWYHKHADDVSAANKGAAELVFLGDSITESWDWGGHDKVFAEFFGDVKTANFGIGGDQTQNLLWRMQNSLKGDLNPKAVVILIGVNNFGHSNHSAEQVFLGVKAVVVQARINYPNAKIMLNAVFPYDELGTSPNRERVKKTNQLVSTLGDEEQVFFYNFGEVFLDEQKNIPKELMADFLHPTAKGIRLYAEKIKPILSVWLK